MDRAAHVRHASGTVIFESYERLGFNYRMTDVQAAIGREQLRRLPAIVRRRRLLAERYAERLATFTCLALPAEPEWARSNWQSYGVRLAAGLDQRAVMQGLLARGVATRRGVMCAHREPAYPTGTWRSGPGGLRESEQAQDRTILLPLFPRLTEGDQDHVVAALREVCGQP
jgi:dTDP-4-amino-4,6-dideoxygalactose transaminase